MKIRLVASLSLSEAERIERYGTQGLLLLAYRLEETLLQLQGHWKQGSPRKASANSFQIGNSIKTQFNGTLEEAQAYYVGKKFNFGDTDAHPKDKMVKAVRVEQL
jgi:hypothetical protein